MICQATRDDAATAAAGGATALPDTVSEDPISSFASQAPVCPFKSHASCALQAQRLLFFGGPRGPNTQLTNKARALFQGGGFQRTASVVIEPGVRDSCLGSCVRGLTSCSGVKFRLKMARKGAARPAESRSASPATLSNFLRPLIDGNAWLQYEYTAGVNGAQILKHKRFVHAVLKAEGRCQLAKTLGPSVCVCVFVCLFVCLFSHFP